MVKEWLNKVKSFIIECKRVWLVTRKPSMPEFKIITKVTGVGILVIGLIGFTIAMLWQIIK
ncbi:MAG: protein translocase SEC61 complex subunit gamma [Nanoarchaeota archaeon]